MPDVDTEPLSHSSLVSNGKEVSVRLELGYPPQLVSSDPRQLYCIQQRFIIIDVVKVKVNIELSGPCCYHN